jgi:3',5'-cyclic AMP phosphodiesterase CpdA
VEPGRASNPAGWYRFTIRSPAGHICAAALAALALLGAAPASSATGIVAIGDFGVGGERQRLMGSAVERFADRRPVDALVTLGDNDYTERPARFRANWLGSFRWAAADGLLVAGTLGNHDIRVGGGSYEFELLGMPGRYYQQRLGQVELFLLDSNRLDQAQLVWLDAALDATNALWTVVAMHHPAYSCGGYRGTRRVRERLVPIFAEHEVDVVLAAHDHNYQRFAKRDGVAYVVNGGGGANLYQLRRCPSRFPRRVRAYEKHGWLYLRARSNALVVRAIGPRGGVQDRLDIELPQG